METLYVRIAAIISKLFSVCFYYLLFIASPMQCQNSKWRAGWRPSTCSWTRASWRQSKVWWRWTSGRALKSLRSRPASSTTPLLRWGLGGIIYQSAVLYVLHDVHSKWIKGCYSYVGLDTTCVHNQALIIICTIISLLFHYGIFLVSLNRHNLGFDGPISTV